MWIQKFFILFRRRKSRKCKLELDNNSRLELENDVHEVEILDEEEIDKYLEDEINVKKDIECLECEKWPEEIRKKVEELEKLEIIGNNPIRKDNKEIYKLKIKSRYNNKNTRFILWFRREKRI